MCGPWEGVGQIQLLGGWLGGSGNSPHTKEEAACHQERKYQHPPRLVAKMLTSWAGGRRGRVVGKNSQPGQRTSQSGGLGSEPRGKAGETEAQEWAEAP